MKLILYAYARVDFVCAARKPSYEYADGIGRRYPTFSCFCVGGNNVTY